MKVPKAYIVLEWEIIVLSLTLRQKVEADVLIWYKYLKWFVSIRVGQGFSRDYQNI